MNRRELRDRVTRIGNEEPRLKKEIWKRILRMLHGHWCFCAQFPNTPMVVFTRFKDNTLRGRWSHAKGYKVPYLEDDSDWKANYIGFTEHGLIGGVYFGMVINDPYDYTTKQLHAVLKKVEKMKFNNVVDFTLE